MVKHTITILTHDGQTVTVEDNATSVLNLILDEKIAKADDTYIPFHAVISVQDETEPVDPSTIEDDFCVSGGGGEKAIVGEAIVGTSVVY